MPGQGADHPPGHTPQRDPERLRQALLHEMCHIGEPYHGRRFQAKLARLAAAGESWAEKERRDFAASPEGVHRAAVREYEREARERRAKSKTRNPVSGCPEDVLRRFVIHTDEGDIPVELTFDPTPLATPDRRAAGDRAPREQETPREA